MIGTQTLPAPPLLRWFLLPLFLSLVQLSTSTHEDCPWYSTLRDDDTPDIPTELKHNCICALNPSSSLLSIQCQEINAQNLMKVLEQIDPGNDDEGPLVLELLYLNASRVTDANGRLMDGLFKKVEMMSLQLSHCGIKTVPRNSLGGSKYLKHIAFPHNEIEQVPTFQDKLDKLSVLDLSYNKLKKIPSRAFQNLKGLATLKLNDNSFIELDDQAFQGLEGSLKNLNLKGTRISQVPHAIRELEALSFLDLAQNRIKDLRPSGFRKLRSLTALNLERNLLQSLNDKVFNGLNLSSLSLLNNLITNFPRGALKSLNELRVLDLGFNLLTEIPRDAFQGLKSLTLLALDGNPLPTLEQEAFLPLNNTLKGISLGGRFLNCDCRLEWILEWVKEHDLQVTSRERDVKFCGYPERLKGVKSFGEVRLSCPKNETKEEISTSTSEAPRTQQTFTEVPIRISSRTTSTTPATTTGFPKFLKPRRPRPTANSNNGKVRPFGTTTSTTTTTPTSITSKPPAVAVISEDEDDLVDLMVDKSSEIEAIRHVPSTSEAAFTESTTTTTTSTTTKPTRTPGPVIRPFNSAARPNNRINPKTVPTTTIATTTTTTRSTTTTTTGVPLPSSSSIIPIKVPFPPRLTTARPTPLLSKTIEAIDHHQDDSKIPVISGRGSAVSASSPSSPSLHTGGNIMTVKQPTPILHSKAIENLPPPSRIPPNLLLFSQDRLPQLPLPHGEIEIHEMVRTKDSILLQWEAPRNLAGFRVIYRTFGEDNFKHGPPLARNEREYRIKNIPSADCLIVCIIPFEEILTYDEVNPGNLPEGSQCREVKPREQSLMNHMDKITIGASAAICISVLVAVLIFIWVTRRDKKSKKDRPSTASTMIAHHHNKSSPYMTPPPQGVGGGGGGVVSNSQFSNEWDQMSVVSTKSIPRARVFHGSMDALANPHHFSRMDDFSANYRKSFSAVNNPHQHHHHHHHGYPNNNYHQTQNQNHHRFSRSSTSYDALDKLVNTSSSSNNNRSQQNHFYNHSNNNQQQQGGKRKRSTLNGSDSLHTLGGYYNDNNWTDHDMDFYVARNNLVQL